MNYQSRRDFLARLGLSSAMLPWISSLPGLQAASTRPKQRLVIVFSPNGIVPPAFWPDEQGESFQLKTILEPLEPFRKQTLILKGVANKVRGDGDSHMRGMSCLLTGIELFPGNIQGGSDTPAGWPKGISIDQELKNFLQAQEETRTRFGSLELGVAVPHRADPWTRMSYAGPNKPVAPLDNPYQVFDKLYGQVRDREHLASILDPLREELSKLSSKLGHEDRQILEDHQELVRAMERELSNPDAVEIEHPIPPLEPGLAIDNDHMPKVSEMQIKLLVNAFRNDLARISTFQFTNSVGQAKMRWLGIEEGHHSLSHDPDLNEESQKKLTQINRWFCEQIASLATQLRETPEPDGNGNLLDHTLIIWTNELGKGNSHTLKDIPFVLIGDGFGFRSGRSLDFGQTPHNRLHLALAHAMGHRLDTFGNPNLCEEGPLDLT